MPAFDPVRDAVLNSPITQTHTLPSPHVRGTNGSPTAEATRPTTSPSLSRRATDLSVLLNSDSVETPLFTPPVAPHRTSSLSRLLLPTDHEDDRLASVEPLQRTMRPVMDTPTEYHEEPSYFSRRPSSQASTETRRTSASSLFTPITPVHPSTPAPASAGATAQQVVSSMSRSPVTLTMSPRPSSSSSSSSHRPQNMPRPSDSPTMRPPPPPPPKARPETLPYNPRRRITPARSVLIPMTSDEVEMYKHYRGTGSQRLLKRKREDAERYEDSDVAAKKFKGDVDVVVEHYNARPDVGVAQRMESPIIGLKNFNNWVKSVLIAKFAHPAFAASPSAQSGPGRSGARRNMGSGKVLDMGCGKGGDLSKWAKARVREYVGVDIAAVSVDQARGRWESLRGSRFDASFAALDCYSDSLSTVFGPAQLATPFDAVSMQFCMHYAFESEDKARCMLENVTRWLRPGGVFVGTIPNGAQMLHRLDRLPADAEELSFGNSVYKIRFDDRHARPTFGNRYWFWLKDAVENVPEYVVVWDKFVQMAAEYSLRPVYRKEFHEVFEECQDHPEFGPLLIRMKVKDVNGESAMDEDQWEAANIYIAFAFEKR